MAEFCMPSLGADMDDGTLVEWRVSPGDAVTRGDIVAVVETDKSAVEIEIFTTGTIETLLVKPGEKVPVGTVLATVATDHDADVVQPPPTADESAGPQPSAMAAPARGNHGHRVSPAARQLARELDVDAGSLTGTGPRGAVTCDDVQTAAARAVSAPEEQAPMRRAIAAAMSRANREIPQYFLSTQIDMQAAMTWLADYNRNRPAAQRMLASALLIKAVALAVRKVPELNGHYIEDRFRLSDRVHVGMAIALRAGGLIAAAIHDADRRALPELMDSLRDLVSRARKGQLRSSELADATITITSLGERGCDEVFAIINPPQVAMVGFGAVSKRPWVVDGKVVARPIITASLSADHRVSDGHRGGLFLSALAKRLAEPEAT